MKRSSTSARASSSRARAETIALAIKRRIVETTGLTASVGLASNKLLAKIASDLRKPDGFVWIRPEEVATVLDPLPIGRLHGVGKKTAARLDAQGIHMLGQLRLAPDSVLWPLFGRYTQRMRERAAGIDERPVVADWEEKSISAEETFEHDIRNRAALQRELAEPGRPHLRASARQQAHVVPGAGQDPPPRLHHVHAPAQLLAPHAGRSPDPRYRARASRSWLEAQPRVAVRLLGVGVSRLSPAFQLDLFTADAAPDALGAAVDQIHEKFGEQSLTRAHNLRSV